MPWWGWLIIALLGGALAGVTGFAVWFLVQFAKGFNW